ncbi:hypothetical protein C7212DRAFT_305199, partial [Tuber magnatum]
YGIPLVSCVEYRYCSVRVSQQALLPPTPATEKERKQKKYLHPEEHFTLQHSYIRARTPSTGIVQLCYGGTLRLHTYSYCTTGTVTTHRTVFRGQAQLSHSQASKRAGKASMKRTKGIDQTLAIHPPNREKKKRTEEEIQTLSNPTGVLLMILDPDRTTVPTCTVGGVW